MNLVQIASAAANEDPSITISQGTTTTIGQLITKLLPTVGLIAGAILFFYLIYSGFQYLTAGGNADAAKKGQQGIINAVIGIIIIAGAWILFKIIQNAAQTATA